MTDSRRDPMREAARSRTCPTCSAGPGLGCISSKGKPTDLHHARMLGVPLVRKKQG